MGIEIWRFSAAVSLGRAFGKIFWLFPLSTGDSFLPHTMLRSAPRVSAHTTHRRMAQAPGNGAGAKNGARHPPLAPSPSAEKRTHQPPVFLGGVSGEYDFPGASAGALYDGFHPGAPTPIPVTAASAYRSPTTTGDARVAEDATSRRAAQLKRCRGAGFIAALDQSGGSTPRALSLYGINDIRADDEDARRIAGPSGTRASHPRALPLRSSSFAIVNNLHFFRSPNRRLRLQAPSLSRHKRVARRLT